jgi:hypothetical protein
MLKTAKEVDDYLKAYIKKKGIYPPPDTFLENSVLFDKYIYDTCVRLRDHIQAKNYELQYVSYSTIAAKELNLKYVLFFMGESEHVFEVYTIIKGWVREIIINRILE